MQIKELENEPRIVYKPIKSVYLQNQIKYRNFEKTKLCHEVEKAKNNEQIIKDSIENFILRETQNESGFSRHNIFTMVNADQFDIQTRENSRLCTEITNLPITPINNSFENEPSSRRIVKME